MVDQLIEENFKGSFMSNTKWAKMIDRLTDTLDKVYLDYKLIYDDGVNGFLFSYADDKPYFIEPIIYKEVEWVEIPEEYEDWINPNNQKAGKKIIRQDLQEIKSLLESIGKFELEYAPSKIKLYGYK